MKRIEWPQIVASSGITATLSLLVALIIWSINERQPRLTYQIYPPAVFANSSLEVAIHYIVVRNKGRRLAEDVAGIVRVKQGLSLKDHSLAASSPLIEVSSSTKEDEGTLKFSSPNLNPGEYCLISLLVEKKPGATLDIKARNNVTLDVRAPGQTATAEAEESNRRSDFNLRNISYMIFIIVIVCAALVWHEKRTIQTN